MIDVRFRQIWFNAVLACGDLSPVVRLVAQAIGHAMNVGTGQCNPSYDTLGDRTHQSARTCMRAVKALEDAGWVAVVRTKGRHSNSFVLKMPASVAVDVDLGSGFTPQSEVAASPTATAPAANGDKALSLFVPAEPCPSSVTVASGEPCQSSVTVEGAEPCHSSVTDADGQQCQIGPATVTELCHPNNKNKYTPLTPLAQSGTDIDAAFEELWEIWGNDADKGKARSSFHRAVTGLRVDPSTIIEAARERRLRRLTGHVVEAEPLARWLRGEGWSAETKPATSRKPRPAQGARPEVFVEEGSAPWKAWKEFRRRQGKGTPATSFASQGGRRGWHFPTEFPAGSHEVHHG